MGIIKVGKIVFSRGSILERYFILLKKAKKLDRSIRIEKSLFDFGKATMNAKKVSIRRIERFIKLKPMFDRVQEMEQVEKRRIIKLLNKGNKPSLTKLKLLKNKADKMLRELDSSSTFFI